MSLRTLKAAAVSLMRRQKPPAVTLCTTENLEKSCAQVATSVLQAAPVIQKSCGLKPKRNPLSPVPIRYSEEQLGYIDEEADKTGVTRSEYIRNTSLKGKYQPALHPDIRIELLKTRRQITGIATNINQMAHRMNSGHADAWQVMEFMEALTEPLLDTLSLIQKVLQRGLTGPMP